MADSLPSYYKKLLEKGRELAILESTESIMAWDMETMMPPKAIKLRSQQLSQLSVIDHKMATDPETGRLLEKIIRHPDYDKLSFIAKRNIQLTKKHYDEETKLPERLVAETAKQQAITIDTWKKAKATKNYSTFKPDLEKLLELRKQAAEILMQVKQTETPYDALIDVYEPKMTTHKITKTFNELKTGLISLIEKCESAPQPHDLNLLKHTVPTETQRKVAKALTEFIGYDTTSRTAGGRIDETEHPFTTGYYDDVRITTHYYENDFTSSIFSVLHETGHAIYEQNLPKNGCTNL